MPAQCIRYRNILGGRLAHAGRAAAVQVRGFLRYENLFQKYSTGFPLRGYSNSAECKGRSGFLWLKNWFYRYVSAALDAKYNVCSQQLEYVIILSIF